MAESPPCEEAVEGSAPTDKAVSPHERLLIELRTTARERFWSAVDRESYECPCCGASEGLEVHHRDGNPFNNHLLNLVAACHRCHKSEHRRRKTADSLGNWKVEFDALTSD